ncbi:HupE/UreJ family protein [Microbulbifer hydrolyticus]|uniref:HupE/UreJ family protein n=1 Tax=Microbulbifer hydrolyticus TaxID=48074 RepID=A0A6P1T9N1_9GAMM|nr:HupE/UreJ family protein [Microbulbifer hydrolyticus]MBB5212845.1 hydrogenase/urease accessory protein HupE [Microbulbifer hydrolyticus]QHQ38363.1 HupE/UreJ family protein [Microbulbifer hydrolyticus]
MRILLLFATLLFSAFSLAHELRPASLSVVQTAPEKFDVTWRVPARGDMRLSLYVQFDQRTQENSLPVAQMAGGYYVERWEISHPDNLVGSTIAIDGLASTMTDALVRVSWLDGREQVTRLLPDKTQLVVEDEAGMIEVAGTYFVLGIEHILLGIDHLLFVLALVVLVSGGRQLIATITAFTVAHSITLALAVLGMVSVPQAPVEAVIALSIVFIATEILHKLEGRKTLAIRKPWVVAFGFGLLHGLGFAGALSEIGVPEHAIPLSLGLFNVGVEAGQLTFIAAVCGLMFLLRRVKPVQLWETRTGTTATAASALPVAYLVGGLSAWWLVDRTIALIV